MNALSFLLGILFTVALLILLVLIEIYFIKDFKGLEYIFKKLIKIKEIKRDEETNSSINSEIQVHHHPKKKKLPDKLTSEQQETIDKYYKSMP